MTATPQPPRVTVEHKCSGCGAWMPAAHGKKCFACVCKRWREQERQMAGRVCERPGCGQAARDGSRYCCSFCNVQHFNAEHGHSFSEETLREAAQADQYWHFVADSLKNAETAAPTPAKVDRRIAKLLSLANDPAATPAERETARRLAARLQGVAG